MNKQMYEHFRKIMGDIHLANSHTHLPPESHWHDVPRDFTQIIAYCIPDLMSSGMPKENLHTLTDGAEGLHVSYGTPFKPDTRTALEKWEAVKPYWPLVRNTGSGMHARRVLELFFGCDDFTDETIPIIESKMAEMQKKTYKEFFEEFKIDKTMGVAFGGSRENPPTELIPQQLFSDTYTQPISRDSITLLEQLSGMSIYSLDTYVAALDKYLEYEIKEVGMIGFKWHTTPFVRENHFDVADEFEASKALDKILTTITKGSLYSGFSRSYEEMKPLHDYLQNHLIQKAIEFDVPIQIHTGTFGASMGFKLQYSNPTLLTDMILRYPQAKFNLLHSSWPYSRELGEMARIFNNVFINTSWMQIISPESFKRFMKEWMLQVPINKILGFGCDEFSPLNTSACADIYRDLMAQVFAEMVEENLITEKDAIYMAQRVSRDNVLEHWNIKC